MGPPSAGSVSIPFRLEGQGNSAPIVNLKRLRNYADKKYFEDYVIIAAGVIHNQKMWELAEFRKSVELFHRTGEWEDLTE